MTTQRSFKRLVRSRMEKTGESYTAARAQLLARGEPEPKARRSRRPTRRSGERTGRGWEEWFDLLDEWGAAERTHREIARWVAEQQGIDPLAWNAQAVAGSYERARGLRAVGEHPDGFTITASKTVAVPVERLYDAFVDPSLRERWLPDGELRERTARSRSPPASTGATATPGSTSRSRPRATAKSLAALQHERLADAAEAERMKAYWRERVAGAQGGAGAMSAVTHVGTVIVPVADQDRALELLRRRRSASRCAWTASSATVSAGSRSRRPGRRRRSRSCPRDAASR